MTFTSLLTHTAAIQTAVSSQNELGEWLFTYTTSSTPFTCRMSPITAMERIDPTGRFDDVRYRCFSESSTRISVDNRIFYNGTVYRVKEVILDSSYHHKSSLLAEL